MYGPFRFKRVATVLHDRGCMGRGLQACSHFYKPPNEIQGWAYLASGVRAAGRDFKSGVLR